MSYQTLGLVIIFNLALVSGMPLSDRLNSRSQRCLSKYNNPNFCETTCQSGVYDEEIAPCCQELCLMTNKKLCLTSFPKLSTIPRTLDQEAINVAELDGFFECARTWEPACALVGNNATIKKHPNDCQLCEHMIFYLQSQSYIEVDIAMCVDETIN